VTLSSHVLDTEAGRPVAGLPLRVYRVADDGTAELVADTRTDADGRATDLVDAASWAPGRWRLVFDTAAAHGPQAFYPEVVVDVRTADASHHHVPLLLSRHGYATYRGS
jgi:5-hydroxyisourate hydrolase